MNPTPPDLAPIQPPPQRLWREFRIQVLPWIGFAALALIVALLWGNVVVPRSVDADPPARAQGACHSSVSASNGVSDNCPTKD